MIMKYFLPISKYLFLLFIPLLMSCDPFPTESIYPSHCYSLDIFNDTGLPVCIHMNFDLENDSVYTMGEKSVIINKGESYSFMRDRFFKSNSSPFKTAWKGINSNKLYLRAVNHHMTRTNEPNQYNFEPNWILHHRKHSAR